MMVRITHVTWLCIAFFCSIVTATPNFKEYINSFHSDITVNADGSMYAQETIVYTHHSKKEKHGIRRSIPIRYIGPYDTKYTVQLDVIDVTHNGHPSPYQVENIYSHKNIYVGSRDTTLPRGTHTYTITYHTNRQLGFFDSHDELYWNITGNDWNFPVMKTSAHITLPQSISTKAINVASYIGTGFKDDIDTADTYIHNTTVHIAIDQTLMPGSGLTTSITWPKGHIKEPTWQDEIRYFVHDNAGILLTGICTLLLLIYYAFMYRRVRRKEQIEPIFARFYPPEDTPPSAAHYTLSMRNAPEQLTAEIVNMAVNGLITIEEKKSGLQTKHILHKKATIKKKDNNITHQMHSTIMKQLFASKDTVTLENEQVAIQSIDNNIFAKTRKKFAKDYFINNFHLSIPPAICVAFLYIAGTTFEADIFNTSIAVILLIADACLVALAIHLLRSYTHQGLKLRNEILGFKQFLSVTETERLKVIGTPPNRTPELYETYLPYAIAFGVEKKWAQAFAPVFQQMRESGKAYRPIWYSGHMRNFKHATFAHSINQSIASSTTTKGAQGAGRAGGGRGGGGGGSW